MRPYRNKKETRGFRGEQFANHNISLSLPNSCNFVPRHFTPATQPKRNTSWPIAIPFPHSNHARSSTQKHEHSLSRFYLRYAKCERNRKREREGWKDTEENPRRRFAREIQRTHTRRILERRRRRRRKDESIGDVETPVAKQFFDRINARTCVGFGLSLFLRFLSFFAHRARYGASQMDRNLSFQRCALHDGVSGIFLQCSARARWFKLNRPLHPSTLLANRPFSGFSCFALYGNEWVKWFLLWNDGRFRVWRECNGYCAGLMIVLVSFIFLESSEWRKFTTELALAGFLSSRASLGVC